MLSLLLCPPPSVPLPCAHSTPLPSRFPARSYELLKNVPPFRVNPFHPSIHLTHPCPLAHVHERACKLIEPTRIDKPCACSFLSPRLSPSTQLIPSRVHVHRPCHKHATLYFRRAVVASDSYPADVATTSLRTLTHVLLRKLLVNFLPIGST